MKNIINLIDKRVKNIEKEETSGQDYRVTITNHGFNNLVRAARIKELKKLKEDLNECLPTMQRQRHKPRSKP